MTGGGCTPADARSPGPRSRVGPQLARWCGHWNPSVGPGRPRAPDRSGVFPSSPDSSNACVTLGGALQQDGAFWEVPGERGRAAELAGRLVVAAEPGQKVGAHAGQVV